MYSSNSIRDVFVFLDVLTDYCVWFDWNDEQLFGGIAGLFIGRWTIFTLANKLTLFGCCFCVLPVIALLLCCLCFYHLFEITERRATWSFHKSIFRGQSSVASISIKGCFETTKKSYLRAPFFLYLDFDMRTSK